ncbi:hypothetical protein MX582_004675 [Salmonella enterica]|nr:hypothetical protein [Salmonella enterica]EKQ0934093.1 hypothetical protein [Salmonella enterica]EKQ0938792.1 hypothetical protein [Salmonella enterica]
MNMVHKCAIAGAIALTTLSATAVPIDPEELTETTAVRTPVTITKSGTAPIVTWEEEPGLKDTIKDGDVVGKFVVEPYVIAKVCFKAVDPVDGNFIVRSTDYQSQSYLSIYDRRKAMTLHNGFDTEACSEDGIGRGEFGVVKVGNKMNPGVYNGIVYVAAMAN